MTTPNVAADRLPPVRAIRLYTTIATRMVELARSDSRAHVMDGALRVAAASMSNVQDAIAVLQEHEGTDDQTRV